MNNVLSRKYILISLVIHLAVFVVMAYVIHNNRISKTFLVFGVHSKKPTHAIMKFGRRHYVPFLGGRHSSVNGKQGSNGGRTKAKVKSKNKVSKGKRSLTLHEKKESDKKILAKNKRVRVPTVIRKETSVLEKQTKQTALAAGVSVHKKLSVKKVRAEKLKKLRELEAQRAEQERRAHEEAVRRARELRLAKLEEELRKKEALEKQKETQRAEAEKAKVLLAQKEEQKNIKEDDAASRDDDNDDDDGNLARSGDNIFAENSQDIMEFNLLAESDQELRVYQRSIQNEVSRLWHPPVGVPKGTLCRVMFAVSRDGSVEKFEFVSHSKMLIYDLSILRVAKQFKFDECLWGKRFTIDFCQ